MTLKETKNVTEKSETAKFANQILRVDEAKRAAAETIFGLGHLYESHSDLEKARGYYKEAFELYPGYTEARDAYFRLDTQLNTK